MKIGFIDRGCIDELSATDGRFVCLLPEYIQDGIIGGFREYLEWFGGNEDMDEELVRDSRFRDLLDEPELQMPLIAAHVASQTSGKPAIRCLFAAALGWKGGAGALDWLCDNADEFLIRRACGAVWEGEKFDVFSLGDFEAWLAEWGQGDYEDETFDEQVGIYERSMDLAVFIDRGHGIVIQVSD